MKVLKLQLKDNDYNAFVWTLADGFNNMSMVGRRGLTVSKPVLKAPMVSAIGA